ncbi:MAG: sensor histidine kinase [Chloroflexaceae bacterium]|nr:sensor histidine kinase [Chloroflexaceae bacterium]
MAENESKDKLQELLDEYRKEQDRIHREYKEIEGQVRQTTTDVERLSQRELQVSNRVRDLEINIDRYSKAEIKNFYTAAQEVQMRLQMMRAQLEQLQMRQNALRNQQDQVTDFVKLLEEMSGMGNTNDSVDGEPSSDDLILNFIQAQEQERQRLSLQMHDAVAQVLSNLVLRAQICERLMDHDTERARNELSGLKNAINASLQNVRRFIFDLHPMVLEDLGLLVTLRRFVAEFGEKQKIDISLMSQGLEGRLPKHYDVTLFRFVQEALNNVALHANSDQARVLINASDMALQIVVEDDGVGFHVNDVLSDQNNRRNKGIASMKQQIEGLLRGEFGIESAVGRGTRVAATVPLPQQAQAA